MRVLVVDDSTFMRKAIVRMIESEPGLSVVAQAATGAEALELAKKHQPDIVTLDVEMPEMNGLIALKAILALPDAPAVLMCSSMTTEGSKAAIEALRLGAVDFITKDASHFSLNINNIRDDLVAKLKAIGAGRARKRAGRSTSAAQASVQGAAALRLGQPELIAIGSSTGGPPVVEHILTSLPPSIPPVIVAQHMPVLFTKCMAERLSKVCKIPVHHAEHRMPIEPGNAYIAQGGKHLRVIRGADSRLCIEISEKPTEALYRPSVNELLSSVAAALGPRAVGVVLTGMGDDGMLGAQAMRRASAPVIAQDADSSVVYGMPRAVAESGAASASLNPDQIAAVLAPLVASRSRQSLRVHAA